MLNFQTVKKKLQLKSKPKAKAAAQTDSFIVSEEHMEKFTDDTLVKSETCIDIVPEFMKNGSLNLEKIHNLNINDVFANESIILEAEKIDTCSKKNLTNSSGSTDQIKNNFCSTNLSYNRKHEIDFNVNSQNLVDLNVINSQLCPNEKVLDLDKNLFNSSKQLNPIDRDVDVLQKSFFNDKNRDKSSSSLNNQENFMNSPHSLDNADNLSAKINFKSLDSSIKISDNPFDMLSNKKYKQCEAPKTEEVIKRSSTTEEEILSCIRKHKKVGVSQKIEKKYGIYKQLRLLSKTEITIPNKKYYKFPFDMNVINDGSSVFELFKNEFSSALSSVYANYRRFSESFRVAIQGDVFDFSKKVKCTKGLSRILTLNDVSFVTENNFLVVDEKDVGIVYDIVLNYEIPPNKAIPFILSEYEFENGIVFRTKFKREAIVKLKDSTEYSYLLTGPVFSEDLYIDEDVYVQYN